MTQGNGILVLDLGNSETRVTVMYGKDSTTGRYRERSFELSNRFAQVEEGYTPSSDYSDDTSTILKINAVVNENEVTGLYANGVLQEREFGVAPLRPTSTIKKYESSTTALSFELAVLHAYKSVMAMTRTTDYNQMDITWDVVVLLPPGDIELGHDKISNLIKSVKEVNCVFPAVSFPIKVNNVNVLPEGFCAYMCTILDKGSVLRPDFKYLLKETTLVVDIGAGTTDILVIKDNKIINVTMHTIDRGGNNVTQLVKKAVRLEFNGLRLADTDYQNAIVTGKIKDGSKELDITNIVNKAKEEIASYIINDIVDYFEENEFPVRSISALLVGGGGSVSSDNSDITNPEIISLSQSIIKYLKQLSPNVELVDCPEHIVVKENGDDTVSRISEKVSPRLLNIIGASILAEKM